MIRNRESSRSHFLTTSYNMTTHSSSTQRDTYLDMKYPSIVSFDGYLVDPDDNERRPQNKNYKFSRKKRFIRSLRQKCRMYTDHIVDSVSFDHQSEDIDRYEDHKRSLSMIREEDSLSHISGPPSRRTARSVDNKDSAHSSSQKKNLNSKILPIKSALGDQKPSINSITPSSFPQKSVLAKPSLDPLPSPTANSTESLSDKFHNALMEVYERNSTYMERVTADSMKREELVSYLIYMYIQTHKYSDVRLKDDSMTRVSAVLQDMREKEEGENQRGRLM